MLESSLLKAVICVVIATFVFSGFFKRENEREIFGLFNFRVSWVFLNQPRQNQQKRKRKRRKIYLTKTRIGTRSKNNTKFKKNPKKKKPKFSIAVFSYLSKPKQERQNKKKNLFTFFLLPTFSKSSFRFFRF